MKLAVIIITYNRVRDAQTLMHSIRHSWKKYNELSDVTIYHVFNGKSAWYSSPQYEDLLIRTANDGHMIGASHMIDIGIQTIVKSHIKYDFILVCSADVFFTSPKQLVKTLALMQLRASDIATSFWFHPWAFATEFFIIRPSLAARVFPFHLRSYLDRHVWMTIKTSVFSQLPIVEELFFQHTVRVLKKMDSCRWRDRILIIPGRAFVFFHNRFESPILGYSSFHRKDDKVKLLTLLQNYKDKEGLLELWK